MGYKKVKQKPGRYEFIDNIIKKEDIIAISKLNDTKAIEIIQPVKKEYVWKNIEKYLLKEKPNTEILLWRHYETDTLDLCFLEHIPSVKNFSIVMKHNYITNSDKFSLLSNLEILIMDFTVLDVLGNLDFINTITKNLKQLRFGISASHQLDISIITRFTDLEALILEGNHLKNIDSLSSLKNLREFSSLSSFRMGFDFLVELKELWSVKIEQANEADFSSIPKIDNLKYFELQISSANNLDFVSKILTLQFLKLTYSQVEELPDLSLNNSLRRIEFRSMKKLKNIDSLEHIPALEEFIFENCTSLEPEDMMPILKNKSVKSIFVDFRDEEKNSKFKELMSQHNKNQYDIKDFTFL